jgi:dihydrofolate reductase
MLDMNSMNRRWRRRRTTRIADRVRNLDVARGPSAPITHGSAEVLSDQFLALRGTRTTHLLGSSRPTMRRIITTMHVTLDGKTARPDGWIDWVGAGPDAYDFDAFEQCDTCVLGRLMYGEYEKYWRGVGPDDTPEARRYAEFANRTPHYVLTRTVKEFDWPVARPVSDVTDIAALREQPGGDIFVVGGATVGSFINAGVLDELRLTIHPLIVSEGTSLFEKVFTERKCALTDHNVLADGSIRLVYRAA